MKSLSAATGTIVRVVASLFLAMVLYHGFIAGPNPDRSRIGDADLYADLDSSSEVRHQAALQRLQTRDLAAIPELRSMAESGNEGARHAAFLALEELYPVSDDRVTQAIDECLFELRQSDVEGVRKGAQATIYETDQDRIARVSARLQELGARVTEIIVPRDMGIPEKPLMVEFDAEWRGADEDFLLLTRLSRLRVVYFGASTPVSPDLRRRLHELVPGLRIIATGAPCLGFTGHDTIGGFQIYTVEAESPAAAAGMRPGDVLVSIDSRPIQSFTDLLAVLSAGSAGDVLTLAVRREENVEDLQATLGRYTRSPEGGVRCGCIEEFEPVGM